MTLNSYHRLPIADVGQDDVKDENNTFGTPTPCSKDIENGESTSEPPTRHYCHLKKFIAGCLIMLVALSAVNAMGRRILGGQMMRCGSTHSRAKLPTHFTLPSGDQIPSVALGVWKAKPNEVGNAVKTALKGGYRHIDGAWIYRNEEEVGEAIKSSGVSRKDLFLTSKLWNSFHAPEDVEPTLDDSLSKLGTDYVDLYLIHWPIAFNKDGKPYNEKLTANPYPTWQKLEEMVEKGKVKNIGISNFNIDRVKNLTANPLKIKPAVLQVELNYWNPQPELVKWVRENDLLLEAYSPLGGDGQVGRSLDAPEVKAIAKELDVTPAQVLISWQVQRGVIVLPKSVHADRIKDNLHIVKLPHHLFDRLEAAAASHPPERTVNPSKSWGLPFDIFDD